jgi:Protein of unknown function (DUF1573)
MKKLLIAFLAFASTTAVTAQTTAVTPPTTTVAAPITAPTTAVAVQTTAVKSQKKIADVAKLNTETFEFGKVKQGVPPTATFVVTNIGTEPLLIETASPTCGCTISDYTKSPIAPGKTGTIKATYNAANLGVFHKTLTLKFAGVEEIKSINLAGEVLEATAYDKSVAENGAKPKSPTAQVTNVTNAAAPVTAKKTKHKKIKKVEKPVARA